MLSSKTPVLENSNDRYDSWGVINFGARAHKTARNYENYANWGALEEDEGICSPPLWKSSPPMTPNHENSNLNANSRSNPSSYRYLSPTSRTQAIARGRRELMELVRDMPESSYELSLRDLVEKQPVEVRPEFDSLDENQVEKEKIYKYKKVRITRNGSMNNGGFLLKMVLPVSLGMNKNTRVMKKGMKTNSFSKVPLKPPTVVEGSERSDKEWWKKPFSSSRESRSNSTGSSGSSGSTGNRVLNGSGCLPSFFPFLDAKKNRTEE